jgi:trehalose-phosphatase
LLGLDVDGVLAPLVDHAAEATLLPGTIELLERLADRTPLAIVSGRSLDDLTAMFDFPASIAVYGSHGAERRGAPAEGLDDGERARLDELHDLAQRAAAMAGEGAWVERKPTGVALHVRQADGVAGADAMDWLRSAVRSVPGAASKDGQAVVELLARTASKATALAGERARVGAATVCFVGDDVTDEEAFRSLGDGDVAVRVGTGETAASQRLRNPTDVARMLRALLDLWE